MATSASTITTSNTLEEFRVQFNRLVNDVSVLDAGNSFGSSIIFEGSTDDAAETTVTVTDSYSASNRTTSSTHIMPLDDAIELQQKYINFGYDKVS